MHHDFFGGHGHRLIGGPLIVLLLGLALIGAVVLAVVLFSRDRHHGQAMAPSGLVGQVGVPSTASRILDERFARGEIDDDEYQRRKRVLAMGQTAPG